jgi:hypothetical protein
MNCNYAYTDTLLASLYDEYDLLMLQELPWAFVKNAPSSSSWEGEAVVGPPISPNWGCIFCPSSVDDPPHVVMYFNVHIKPLRPSYCRDLIDHRDIVILSLGLGAGCSLFANVYSDANHTAITALHKGVWTWPNLMVMGGHFNVRHKSWDPIAS